jgi:hypothetical protein
MVLKIAKEPISLETPVGEEDDSSLGDFVEDRSALSPQDAVVERNLSDQTRRVLSTLAPREERVLKMRFGIGEHGNHTLEEVGQDFEVTRERIRQIEAKALRKPPPEPCRLLKASPSGVAKAVRSEGACVDQTIALTGCAISAQQFGRPIDASRIARHTVNVDKGRRAARFSPPGAYRRFRRAIESQDPSVTDGET